MAKTPDDNSLPPKAARKMPPRKPPQRKPVVNETTEAADAFAFAAASGGSSTSVALKNRRKKSSVGTGMFLLFAAFAIVALGAVLAMTLSRDDSPTFTIKPLDKQRIDELAPFELLVQVDPSESFSGTLQYSLENAPKGASIDATSGNFTWQPTESHGPGQYNITVYVADADDPQLKETAQLVIEVREANRPPVLQPIKNQVVAADGVLRLTASAVDPDSPSLKLRYSLTANSPAGASIDSTTGRFTWNPSDAEPDGDYHCDYHFEIQVTELTRGGLSATQGFDVHVQAAKPVENIVSLPKEPENVEPPIEEPQPVPVDIPEPEATPLEKAHAKILTMFQGEQSEEGKKDKKGTLFSRNEYPALRKIHADLFELNHQAELKEAFAADYEDMTAWFEENENVKEEFFTAIDTESDKIVPALKLFNEIRKKFPEKIAVYGELAIATAVVWDHTSSGVYEYGHHASRAKSTMPEGLLDALGNFQYLVETEQWMQGRIRYMPWEFLTLTVNHKTPLAERKWAMSNYWAKRSMFGSCYKEVPYDHLMLSTKSEKARLNGMVYNLPNIRQYGGVCAHQADYASRVGKSIGIPAAYVNGESTSGGRHAWVMWVELLGVTKNRITFSLQSYGRYRGDKYYVGNLRDPQTGKPLTDRQLELRLQTVGLDPLAKRHSQLVMKSYPMLVEKAELDVAARLQFLFDVTGVCAGNEDAWRGLAKMSRDGLITKEDSRKMTTAVRGMFSTFQKFPDFTWELFDDLIAFQDNSAQRGNLYGQLVMSYEAVGRPDLACEARLKYVDYLVAENKHALAIDGLARGIMTFPEEGRYVPKMLDRLEELCKQVEGKQQDLLNFYKMFLPNIPKLRGSSPSEYCIKMYERAIQRFNAAGDVQAATACQLQLQAIRAGKG